MPKEKPDSSLPNIWIYYLLELAKREVSYRDQLRLFNQNKQAVRQLGVSPDLSTDQRRLIDSTDTVSRALSRLTFDNTQDFQLLDQIVQSPTYQPSVSFRINLRRDEHLLRAANARRQIARDVGKNLLKETIKSTKRIILHPKK